MSFHLEKWYCDLTTDAGEAFIGYAATLTAGLTVDYTSLLEHDPSGTRTRTSLRRGVVAADSGGGWSLNAAGIETRASYRPIHRGPVVEVLEDEPGAVRWHLLAPLCETRLTTAGRDYQGLGYLERLELNVPPWRLPIRRLRWGRFVHPRASMVWLDWAGERNRRLVVRDGVEVADPIVEADLVGGDGFRLTITARRTLREGALGRAALAAVDVVSRIAPARFLATQERKMLARGRLECVEGSFEGWVIDEVVTWAR